MAVLAAVFASSDAFPSAVDSKPVLKDDASFVNRETNGLFNNADEQMTLKVIVTSDGDLEEERGGTTSLVAEGARLFSTKFRQSFGRAKDSVSTLAATQLARHEKLPVSVLTFVWTSCLNLPSPRSRC
uniref:Uncharacterized protein n=1 Tax=Peronospora matthiolae TaxID=2874970 RepID=A0AAV1UMU9_9STRA